MGSHIIVNQYSKYSNIQKELEKLEQLDRDLDKFNCEIEQLDKYEAVKI